MKRIIRQITDKFLFFQKFKNIDVHQAKAMMDQGDVTIVDIRKPEAYNEGHIQGASLVNKNNMEEFFEKTDKSKPLICYCYKGISSCLACLKLKKEGFEKLYSIKGGFAAWKNHIGKA